MIVGGRVNSIEAAHITGKPMKGLSINVGVEAIKHNNDLLEIDYFYNASYEGGMGSMKIKGTLFADEEKKFRDELLSGWEKSKKLPATYEENLRAVLINSGTANGVLIARVMDMPPPMPPIRLDKAEKK